MNQGQHIGHYTIIRLLGKGGMGEVYLAEDTKLKREVAIKVLPERLRNDTERLRRFKREAEAAAKLKHNNIAIIYALEEFDDVTCIAMEHVAGESLRHHIPAEGMELDSFFATFIPLADALAHAHAQGRIHRDLKPDNIMIAEDGTPKILDFGLARIIDPDPIQAAMDESASAGIGPDDETQSMNVEDQPSGVPSLTGGGQLIGTPQYMSPEQAERKATDAGTDIFSFGVVMYEAITGRRAFDGASLESIIGRILEAEPTAVTALRPVTPYSLWLAIRQCLKKAPDRRTQTMRELHEQLMDGQQEVQSGTVLVDASTLSEPVYETVEPEPAIPFWRRASSIATFAVALLVGLSAAWLLKPSPPAPEAPLRKYQWAVKDLHEPVISPDGTMVAYIAGSPGSLWIRDMNNTAPREIPGTEGIDGVPFWSPESDHVGFFAQDELRRVDAQGGTALRVCALPGLGYSSGRYNSLGEGIWSADGTILFRTGTRNQRPMYQVPAQGGAPEPWSELDVIGGPTTIETLLVLPGEKNYLISILKKGGTRDLVVQSGTTRQTLVADESDISRGMYYDVSGYLVYKRGYFSWSGIWAKPFDLSTRTITGAPFPVAQNVLSYSLSSDGTLVYKSLIEAGAQQLVWVTRDGQIDGVIGRTQQTMSDPALSPDGRSVAVSAWEPGQDIAPWVYDVTRGSRIRLMAGIGGSTEPAWSPDGRQVAINGISVLAADGSGTPAQMAPGGNNASWSADGEYLVYVNGGTQEQRGERWRDIWYLEVNGNQQPVSLVQTPYNEGTPQVSPDGQFLAYVSDQSGREEVYVTAFPSGEGKWPVSVIGGTHPRWNPKGGELFYVEGDRLMSVSIAPGPQFEAEVPRPLFTQMESGVSLRARGPYWAPPYDVHSDGQRFVMIQSMSGTQAITVVENWHAEFQDR